MQGLTVQGLGFGFNGRALCFRFRAEGFGVGPLAFARIPEAWRGRVYPLPPSSGQGFGSSLGAPFASRRVASSL